MWFSVQKQLSVLLRNSVLGLQAVLDIFLPQELWLPLATQLRQKQCDSTVEARLNPSNHF